MYSFLSFPKINPSYYTSFITTKKFLSNVIWGSYYIGITYIADMLFKFRGVLRTSAYSYPSKHNPNPLRVIKQPIQIDFLNPDSENINAVPYLPFT